MIVEKEVTICVESFKDALEIVDKMNFSLSHAFISMDEDEFFEGKCRVVIDKTLFMFWPIHKLFKERIKEKEEDKMESLLEKYKEEKE